MRQVKRGPNLEAGWEISPKKNAAQPKLLFWQHFVIVDEYVAREVLDVSQKASQSYAGRLHGIKTAGNQQLTVH